MVGRLVGGVSLKAGVSGGELRARVSATPDGAPVPDGSITTDKLADGAVTGNKIADGTIPDSKLQSTHRPLTEAEIEAILT